VVKAAFALLLFAGVAGHETKPDPRALKVAVPELVPPLSSQPNGPISVCEFDKNREAYLDKRLIFSGQFADGSPHGWYSFDTGCSNAVVGIWPGMNLKSFWDAMPPANAARRVAFEAVVSFYDHSNGFETRKLIGLKVAKIVHIELIQ
jgi:hypothetical protein